LWKSGVGAQEGREREKCFFMWSMVLRRFLVIEKCMNLSPWKAVGSTLAYANTGCPNMDDC
jgi:hypothetical protein